MIEKEDVEQLGECIVVCVILLFCFVIVPMLPLFIRFVISKLQGENKVIYICIFIFIILFVFLLIYRNAKERQLLKKEVIKLFVDVLIPKTILNIQNHFITLYTDHNTLITQDKWGRIKNEKFLKEFKTFVDEISMPTMRLEYENFMNNVYRLRKYYSHSLPDYNDNFSIGFKKNLTYDVDTIKKLQFKVYCDDNPNFIEIAPNINLYMFFLHKIIFDSMVNLIKSNVTIDLETTDGLVFETIVANKLNEIGFKAHETKGSGDQGVDVFAEKNNKTIAIQCKLYSKPVGNKAVQEIIAGKGFYGTDYGAVVSNKEFTKSARDLAQKSGIYLINFSLLESEIINIFK